MSRKKKKKKKFLERMRDFWEGDIWDDAYQGSYPDYGYGSHTKYKKFEPKPRYECFMLEPTNRYRGITKREIVVEIEAEEAPMDTLDIEYHRVYVKQGTTEECILQDAPTGAIWFAPWLDQLYKPQLEHVIVIRLPDGKDFMPDAKAENCRGVLQYSYVSDRKKAEAEGKKVITATEVASRGAEEGVEYTDVEPSFWQKLFSDEPIEDDHHCWLVHGTLPKITIDKHGRTCTAGGGSIASNGWQGWHGFLKDGVLE